MIGMFWTGSQIPDAIGQAAACAALLALLMLAGCETTQARNDRLVRFMDELLFGGPFDAHQEQDKHLARWNGPMRVAMAGAQAEGYHERVGEEVKAMGALAGLEARMVGAAGEANVIVTLVDESDFLVNEEYAGCYVSLGGSGSGIRQATIYIGMAQADNFERCIAHELMHVFGFRFHSGVVSSVLSPAHGEEALTAWDELALQVLYDPRLETGIARDMALPVVRQIVSERTAR